MATAVLRLISGRGAGRSLRRAFDLRRYPQLRTNWTRFRRSLLTKTTFVGVTGSCAKTTTAILVEAILKTAGECRTCAGYNDYGSMIRTVLSLGPSTKFCIQEVSGEYLGKVAKYCRFFGRKWGSLPPSAATTIRIIAVWRRRPNRKVSWWSPCRGPARRFSTPTIPMSSRWLAEHPGGSSHTEELQLPTSGRPKCRVRGQDGWL